MMDVATGDLNGALHVKPYKQLTLYHIELV